MESQQTDLPMNPNSYFRSKAYSVEQGVNPLVAAAAPIFTFVSQSRRLQQDTDLVQLQQNLYHEISAFESHARNKNYRSQHVLAARFALCAFIDEALSRCHQLGTDKWNEHALLPLFHGENDGKREFYVILEHASGDPKRAIDLLELLYLCLSLGFEGQYANNEQGTIIRENIVNNLYQTIRDVRGDINKSIKVAAEAQNIVQKTPWLKNLSFTLALTLVLTTVTWGAGYWTLQQKSGHLAQVISGLVHIPIKNTHVVLPEPSTLDDAFIAAPATKCRRCNL